jgi:hypothetical protein
LGWTTYDDFLNELTVNGKVLDADFAKFTTAGGHTGSWYSFWRVEGYPSAGGDGAVGSGTPGAGGTALTAADGSLEKWANASPDTVHLLGIGMSTTQDCSIMLADRLVSVSAVTVASTGDKNVGSAALPRYSGTASVGVQVFAEVTTATTTTAPVISPEVVHRPGWQQRAGRRDDHVPRRGDEGQHARRAATARRG